MPAWLLVLLIFLTTHRLTRLAIADEVPVVKVPRDALIRFLDPTPQMVAAEPGLKGHWNVGRPNLTLIGCAGALSFWGIVYAAYSAVAGHPVRAAAIVVAVFVAATLCGIVASGAAGRTLAYLLECPWCMSFWVGGLVVLATDLCTSVPAPFLAWIASSSATGLIANFEARQDQAHELAEIEKRRALAAEQREARR